MNKASDAFNRRVTEFFRTYHDRGMVKWSGFFLSDHKLKINQDKTKRSKIYHKKPEMTLNEISLVLLESFKDHYPVAVQLKNIDENGNYKADITGFVQGYQGEENINISGTIVKLSEINHVEIIKDN